MFDNKPSTPNLGGNVPPQPLTPVRPVAPTPAQPAMPTPPSPMAPKMTMSEPEDILADVDLSQAAVKGPTQPVVRPGSPVPPLPINRPISPLKPVMAPTRPLGLSKEDKEPVKGGIIKIIILIIVILAAVGGLAAAGWYSYKLISKSTVPAVNTNQTAVNANQAAPVVPAATAPATTTATPPANAEPIVNSAPPAAPVDTDRDGLTDAEEALYGTDPNKADTDADGLTDRDEVKVYDTDPLKPDTDGDSYLDGEEVINGYDPNGPGKLLKIK